MLKNGFIIIIILFFFISCSITKKGVFFKEMRKSPSIEINDNKITIITENSIENSALLIYKIELSLDTAKKTINLTGFQGIGKENKTRFELRIKGLSKKKLDNYDYYWIDPDKSKNKIEKIVK
jgi:hypothetical protein